MSGETKDQNLSQSKADKAKSTELEASGLITLAIDTSGAMSSLALARDGRLIAALTLMEARQHSQIIFEHLEMLLSLARLRIEEVNLFAAVTGPGSFTGLRIGLAAIGGISASLRKPVFGVTTFDAFAHSARITGSVMTLIDAGRGEVFCGMRRVETDPVPAMVGKDIVGSVESVIATMREAIPEGEGLYITGGGAIRYQDEILRTAAGLGAVVSVSGRAQRVGTQWTLNPRAETLAPSTAEIATRLYLSGMRPGLHPYYLKPSDAEAKWKSLAIQT